MRTPALTITITLFRPGEGWHYTARKWGEPVACSDGDEGFDQPGRALLAALTEIKAGIPKRQQEDEP